MARGSCCVLGEELRVDWAVCQREDMRVVDQRITICSTVSLREFVSATNTFNSPAQEISQYLNRYSFAL